MMKLVKLAIMPFWKASAFIRRPLVRRIDDRFFSQIEPRARKLSAEVVPGLDGLLREMERLQTELDRLQNALASAQFVTPADTKQAKAG